MGDSLVPSWQDSPGADGDSWCRVLGRVGTRDQRSQGSVYEKHQPSLVRVFEGISTS